MLKRCKDCGYDNTPARNERCNLCNSKNLEIIKEKRRRFTQTTIFEHFKARCEDCGTKANLTTHHKNSNPSDISLKNLGILCINCHRKREGIDKKKKDLK